ncbi:MAG: H+transporting two-sector ATPase subunit [Myxococcales bacterium]|nr:H+transporting two-sector ATPase subunit [Myxococcales bacterium]
MSLRRLLGAFAVAATLLVAAPLFVATPLFAQENPVAHEQKEGSKSAEGGGYGAGPDVNEGEAQGIVNWWSWDYGPNAKDPTHKNLPPPFGFALINFGIFLAIMSRLAWKPLKQFIRERHDSIAKNLHEAARLRSEAEAALGTYQTKILGLDAEIDTLLVQIRKEAETEKARIIAAAEADAARLRLEAERQIAAEIERARRELRRGVIEAAVGAADETLKKNIAADDQRKMAERYVGDVEARAKTGRPS